MSSTRCPWRRCEPSPTTVTSRTASDPKVAAGAADTLRRAEAAGVDLAAITAQLEREGVQAFRASYGELIASIERKLTLARAAV